MSTPRVRTTEPLHPARPRRLRGEHEATSFSLALLLATERLKVISAVHPSMWHPEALPIVRELEAAEQERVA